MNDPIVWNEQVGCPVWYITQEDSPGWHPDIDDRLAIICEVPWADPEEDDRPLGWNRPPICLLNAMYAEWRSWD